MSQWGDKRDFLDAVQSNLPLTKREAEMLSQAFNWKGAEIDRDEFEDHQDVFDDIAKHVPWFD